MTATPVAYSLIRPKIIEVEPATAIPQKSPCTCSLGRQPLLTQLIELCLGLSQGPALHAEPLAMRSKALPFLCQVLGRSVTQGIQDFGLCRWPG